MSRRGHDDDLLGRSARQERVTKRLIDLRLGERILRRSRVDADNDEKGGKDPWRHTPRINHGIKHSNMAAIMRAET
jgi:hypothetical protein